MKDPGTLGEMWDPESRPRREVRYEAEGCLRFLALALIILLSVAVCLLLRSLR